MILLYHKISKCRKTRWYVTVETFRRQMQWLKDHRMKVVSFDDYDPLDKRHVVITIDGGYEEMFAVAVKIFNEFQYPYEIFIIGNYVGKDNSFDTVEPLENFLSSDQLRSMVAQGAHLQWHTNSHPMVDAIKTRDDWIKELTVPDSLRSLDPNGFRVFAYPYGGNAEWQYQSVRERFDSAVFVGGGSDTDRYRMNRVVVYEESDFDQLFGVAQRRYVQRALKCLAEGRMLKSVAWRIKSVFGK